MTQKRPFSSLLSHFGRDPESQQFTSGVVSEGVFAESFWKFCGKFAEICQKMRSVASGKGAEILRKAAEISRKFTRNIFCNDPFPNDPITYGP